MKYNLNIKSGILRRLMAFALVMVTVVTSVSFTQITALATEITEPEQEEWITGTTPAEDYVPEVIHKGEWIIPAEMADLIPDTAEINDTTAEQSVDEAPAEETADEAPVEDTSDVTTAEQTVVAEIEEPVTLEELEKRIEELDKQREEERKQAEEEAEQEEEPAELEIGQPVKVPIAKPGIGKMPIKPVDGKTGIIDEPVTDEPVSDEPVSDEPVSDEPVSDEPVTDEPVSDEPVSDEPVTDEPVSDEPKEGEDSNDEAKSDEEQPEEKKDSIALTGDLPVDCTVRAIPVTMTLTGYKVVAAYDITIFDAEGNKWQPEQGNKVGVEISNKDVAQLDEELTVLHMADSKAKPEEIGTVQGGDAVQFDAESFSIYVVAGKNRIEYLLYIDEACTTPYMFSLDGVGGTLPQITNRIIVKQGDTLVFPQEPTDPEADPNDPSSRRFFRGWYKKGTADEVTPGEVGEITTDQTGDNAVKLYAKFGEVVYVVFHENYTKVNDTYVWPVRETKRVFVDDNHQGQVLVSDIVPQIEEYSLKFIGWSTSKEDNRTVITTTKVGDDEYLTVNSNVNLFPVYKQMVRVSYVTGPTGSGATYIPPVTIEKGTPLNSANPYAANSSLSIERDGYTFLGWCTLPEYVPTYDSNGNIDSTCDYTTSCTHDEHCNETHSSGHTMLSGNLSNYSTAASADITNSDVTLYACWQRETTAPYRVVVWQQKVSRVVNGVEQIKAGAPFDKENYDFVYMVELEDSTDPDTYISFTDSSLKARLTEEQQSHLPDTEEKTGAYDTLEDVRYDGGFYFLASDEKNIEPDGSTVINVYYNRNEMEIRIYKGEGYSTPAPPLGYAETVKTFGEIYGIKDPNGSIENDSNFERISYQQIGWVDAAGNTYSLNALVYKGPLLIQSIKYNLETSPVSQNVTGYLSRTATSGIQLARVPVSPLYSWVIGTSYNYNFTLYENNARYEKITSTSNKTIVATLFGLYDQPIPRSVYSAGDFTGRDTSYVYVRTYNGTTNVSPKNNFNFRGVTQESQSDPNVFRENGRAVFKMYIKNPSNVKNILEYYRQPAGMDLDTFQTGVKNGTIAPDYSSFASSTNSSITIQNYAEKYTGYTVDMSDGAENYRVDNDNGVQVYKWRKATTNTTSITFSFNDTGTNPAGNGTTSNRNHIKVIFTPLNQNLIFLNDYTKPSEPLVTFNVKNDWSLSQMGGTDLTTYNNRLVQGINPNTGAALATPFGDEGKTVFGGWYYDEAFTEPFNPNDPVTHQTYVFAKWDVPYYMVRIDPDGGEILGNELGSTWFWVPYDGRITRYDSTQVSRNYIQQDGGGYYYHYWSYDYREGTGNYNSDASTTSGFNLNEEYHSDLDDDSDGVDSQNAVSRTAGYDKIASNSTDGGLQYRPMNGLYQLDDWYELTGATYEEGKYKGGTMASQPFNFDTHIRENKTLRAVWKKIGIFTINYRKSATVGDTTVTGDFLVDDRELYGLYDENNQDLHFETTSANRSYVDGSKVAIQISIENAKDTTNKEYQFHGWRVVSPDPGNTNLVMPKTIFIRGELFEVDEKYANADRTITLEPVFGFLDTYKITYNANGGNGTLTDLSSLIPEGSTQKAEGNLYYDIEKNDEVILSSGAGFTHSNSDMVLVGWSEVQNPGADDKIYTPGQKVAVDSDITLYAVWKEGKKVTLNLQAANAPLRPIRFSYKINNGEAVETSLMHNKSWDIAVDGSLTNATVEITLLEDLEIGEGFSVSDTMSGTIADKKITVTLSNSGSVTYTLNLIPSIQVVGKKYVTYNGSAFTDISELYTAVSIKGTNVTAGTEYTSTQSGETFVDNLYAAASAQYSAADPKPIFGLAMYNGSVITAVKYDEDNMKWQYKSGDSFSDFDLTKSVELYFYEPESIPVYYYDLNGTTYTEYTETNTYPTATASIGLEPIDIATGLAAVTRDGYGVKYAVGPKTKDTTSLTPADSLFIKKAYNGFATGAALDSVTNEVGYDKAIYVVFSEEIVPAPTAVSFDSDLSANGAALVAGIVLALSSVFFWYYTYLPDAEKRRKIA